LQIGDVIADRAVVWSRSDKPARMFVDWSVHENFDDATTVRGPYALEAGDFTSRVDLADLPRGRDIFVRVTYADLDSGKARSEPVVGRSGRRAESRAASFSPRRRGDNARLRAEGSPMGKGLNPDKSSWTHDSLTNIMEKIDANGDLGEWRPMSGVEPIVRAFSAEHVVKLTNLSHAQLRYWDRTGFFKPEYADGSLRSPFGRVYSFQNVVGLRTLGLLRKFHRVSLQHLREVAEVLGRYRNAPWSEMKLYVLNKRVYFQEPETGRVRSALEGQYVCIELEDVAHNVAAEANKLTKRSQDQVGRVERNRYVAHNAWVISGTRIPTKTIWRYHDAGFSTARIIREYPTLTESDVRAAIEHEERQAQRA
jgi:uncharacterized protein (DUF433 family)